MSSSRRLGLPITLATIMIVLLVILIVGWILLSVFGAIEDHERSAFYWAWLSIGTTFLALVLAGVITYLVLTIKAINLGRRQSNFIDSVTHELKSPVASLKLYLQTLTRRQVSREQEADFYRVMLEDVDRLDHLINHLLEVGRLERESETRDLEQINLHELIGHCADSICMRYRVPLETVTIAGPPAEIVGPRVDLDMIFRNLIDNAVKYGAAEPDVEITIEPLSEGRGLVRVCDNGPGIPKAMRRKIFGRFFRMGLELEREKLGTGLGLYIVRTLVRRHRGRISVHDREGQTGSEFRVDLPGVAFAEPPAKIQGNHDQGAKAAKVSESS